MDLTAQILYLEQDTVYSLMNFLVYNFQAFIKQRNYPAHVPVTKVPESGEPSEFKALFKQWDIMRTPAQMKAYSNNKIGLTFQNVSDTRLDNNSKSYVYRLPTKSREVNVFSHVCHSVWGGAAEGPGSAPPSNRISTGPCPQTWSNFVQLGPYCSPPDKLSNFSL